jgi:outer membrane protein, multidrug efflux system
MATAKSVRWIGRGALLLAAALAGACKVGPDYTGPQHDELGPAWSALKDAAAAPKSKVTAEPVATVRWWTLLNDETLNSLIERAFAANLDLRQAEARLREARAARFGAGAELWPTVDLNASYTKTSASTLVPATGNRFRTSHDLYRAGFDAAWEIDLFGGVQRSVEAADADLQATLEDQRDVLITVAAEVAVAYVDLVTARRETVISRENLEAQERSAELTRRRHVGGFVSAVDVADAEAQAATTRSQIPSLEATARQSLYALGVLLGLPPNALEMELADAGTIPSVPGTVPAGLPSDLVRRRPDLRRAEAELHAAVARVGVATADLFPKFALTGSAGVASDRYTSLDRFTARGWSIGPSISWPVLDFGRIRASIAVQDARTEQALLAYERTVLTALQEVESALIAYAKEQEHHLALADAVAANTRSVDLSTRLYAQGQTGFLSVLLAQRSLYASQVALVESDRSQATDLVALQKALGGGWEERAPLPAPAADEPPKAGAP